MASFVVSFLGQRVSLTVSTPISLESFFLTQFIPSFAPSLLSFRKFRHFQFEYLDDQKERMTIRLEDEWKEFLDQATPRMAFWFEMMTPRRALTLEVCVRPSVYDSQWIDLLDGIRQIDEIDSEEDQNVSEFESTSTVLIQKWTVRNIGTCSWDRNSVSVRLVDTSHPSSAPRPYLRLPQVSVGVGDSVVITVPLVTPENEGTWFASFRLFHDEDGFGNLFWVRKKVLTHS